MFFLRENLFKTIYAIPIYQHVVLLVLYETSTLLPVRRKGGP